MLVTAGCWLLLLLTRDCLLSTNVDCRSFCQMNRWMLALAEMDGLSLARADIPYSFLCVCVYMYVCLHKALTNR